MSHRPLTTVIAAAVLLAAVAAPAAAVPAAAVPETKTAPTSAVSAVARPTPIPPAWRKALVQAHRRGAARTGSPAAGPGPGAVVTLPRRIEVGGPTVRLPYVVDVGRDYQVPTVAIDLENDAGDFLAGTYVEGPAGQHVFRGAVTASAFGLLLGAGIPSQWGVVTGEKGSSPNDQIDALVPTTIGFRTIIAQRVTRKGDVVDVFGATRGYSAPISVLGIPGDYESIDGQTVQLQRWTRTGWATIRTLQTDESGHVSTTLRIPFTVGLRLLTADQDGFFGAATTGGAY